VPDSTAATLKVPDLALDVLGSVPFGTVLADPPWRFQNRTGKVAPEHHRLSRYDTMDWQDIAALSVGDLMAEQSHCYLWVPHALLQEGLATLDARGFPHKAMPAWAKRRKGRVPSGRGVAFRLRHPT